MRVFKKPNLMNDWKCPICGTNKEEEVVLCGIVGTKRERIMEAEQIHLDCIDLYYHPDINTLSMKWEVN